MKQKFFLIALALLCILLCSCEQKQARPERPTFEKITSSELADSAVGLHMIKKSLWNTSALIQKALLQNIAGREIATRRVKKDNMISNLCYSQQLM